MKRKKEVEKRKKLELSRETLRELKSLDAHKVLGGVGSQLEDSCESLKPCLCMTCSS
jgi:hypothetical protein